VTILPPPPGAIDPLTKALSLTDQQVTDLKAALAASDAAIVPLLKAASDAAKALHEAVFADTYDADAVAAAVAASADAQAAVVASSLDTWAKIRSILTADQWTKLKAGPGCAPPPGPPPGSGGGKTPPTNNGGGTSKGGPARR